MNFWLRPNDLLQKCFESNPAAVALFGLPLSKRWRVEREREWLNQPPLSITPNGYARYMKLWTTIRQHYYNKKPPLLLWWYEYSPDVSAFYL